MKKNSKHPNSHESNPPQALEDYYDLKTDAVQALVNADTEEIPQYSQEELNKYRTRSPIRIPEVALVCLAKWWFAGAMYYFCGFGLSLSHWVDMLIIYSIVLGMVNDLLTNNLLRFFEKQPGDANRWLMVTRKGVPGMLLNILYTVPVIFAVWGMYEIVKAVATGIAGGPVTVGAEPLSFGLFVLLADLAFLGIKGLILRWIKHPRK